LVSIGKIIKQRFINKKKQYKDLSDAHKKYIGYKRKKIRLTNKFNLPII